VVGVALSLAVASCGQLTGLSDDYHYDLEPGSNDGGGSGEGGGGRPSDAGGTTDAKTDARAPTCSAGEVSTANTVMISASGDNVPIACRTCLADECCKQVTTCGENNDCNNAMKCVFGCQKGGGNKTQCLSTCNVAFQTEVNPCVQASCSSACQLTK
jgi:hypothetical protein